MVTLLVLYLIIGLIFSNVIASMTGETYGDELSCQLKTWMTLAWPGFLLLGLLLMLDERQL